MDCLDYYATRIDREHLSVGVGCEIHSVRPLCRVVTLHPVAVPIPAC